MRTQLLQQLPAILAEAVKPMEQIDSIRIVQVNGMPGQGSSAGGGAGGSGAGATFPEQVMNSALQYQVAKPIIDAVMQDAGLSNQGITGIAHNLASMLKPAPATPAAPVN